jgi:DNA-directed RNA polymerase sigma subunit (sigma70/sigma32)
MIVQNQTAAQRLWADVFGRRPWDAPGLDRDKVLAIIDNLPDHHERVVLRLHYGFEGSPMGLKEIGKTLPRRDGGLGVTRQRAQSILRRGLFHLKHSSRRRAWDEARVE